MYDCDRLFVKTYVTVIYCILNIIRPDPNEQNCFESEFILKRKKEGEESWWVMDGQVKHIGLTEKKMVALI